MPFAWEMLAAFGTLGDPTAMFGSRSSGPKVGAPVGSSAGVIMIIDFTGKRAIVSGSTLGIGFAIAQGLAASGATVAINGPSQNSVDAALSRLTEMMPAARVEGIAADLSGPDGVAAFVARAPETDILVNNLGIFEPKPFDAITDADWQRLFDTNVMSGVRLSRHYLPEMVKRGWGRIVFISSESGLNIPVEMIHYGMTKTAQLAISLGLAVSVAGTGVTVNAVLPGPTRSDGAVAFYAKLAAERGVSEDEIERQFIATYRPSSLIRRLATVEEVANMVVYVCSEQAAATTGAALRVDGGMLRSIA
jgi:NAD(P)-dependent dehydrogenase (short-subunit alcohol dehydrogenase family)